MSSSRLELVIDSRQAQRELNQLEGRLHGVDRAGNRADRSMQGLSGSISSVRTVAMAAGGVFAAMGISSFSSDVFDAVASSEKLRASLKTVTGSVEAASSAWDELLVFASETPFTLDQSVKGFIRMKALGLDPTTESLRSFGNTASAMGEDLMSMVEAVADATTGEFERLKAFGITASKEGEQITFTFQGVETTVRNTASAINDYLERIGNNEFGGAMAEQMETLGGEATNLEDKIYKLYLAIGDAGATDLFNAALDGSAEAVDFLTNNVENLARGVDLLSDAAIIAAGIYTGRFVAGMAAGTLSLANKTKASIADARATATATAAEIAFLKSVQGSLSAQLASSRSAVQRASLRKQLAANTAALTAANNTYTASLGRSTVAARAMGTATRGLNTALTLVGGPLGLLVGAAGLLYVFRDELNLTGQRAGLTEDQIRALRDEMKDMSQDDLSGSLSSLNAELDTATIKAATAREELAKLRSENRGSGALGFGGGELGAEISGMQAVAEAQERIAELNDKINVARSETASRIEQNANAFVVYAERIEEANEETRRAEEFNRTLSSSIENAADKTYSLADSYESLLDRITPNRREAKQYARDLGTLNLALATGRMTAQQYMQAMGMLQESLQAAQREAENTATASEDASQRIANSFLSWEAVADNTLRRIDDSGQSLWLGLIDGSESALDTVKRGFQQTLAEIAHMLTTQKLTFQVAGMMGLDTTGMPGGGGGFNLGSMGSLYNSATKLPYIGDAISSAGSALGFGGSSAAAGGLYANALTGSAAAGGLYAGASTGAAVGGLYGNALTGAATTASGGFMSAVGSAMPWIGAGLLVDNLLGLGITDGIVEGISSIFGGGKSDPRLNISTRGDAGQFSHESVRTGAFGAVGFSEGTKRSNDLFGSVEQEREWLASVAALDNLTAAAARTPEQLDAMTAAVQNMVITSEDAQGAIDQLAGRTAAATSVIDSELTQSLIDAGATAEQIAQRFATASSTIDVISAASARLNLQYDANADGALRYADSLVQAFGSLDSIAAIQDAYYNAAFSDQERLQHQFDDVRGALNGLTDEAPRTVEELRAIVEASQLNGEASQKLAYDLMALAPALKQTNQAVRDAITQQYQDVLGRAPAVEGLNYWFDQVASGALTLEGALSSIANSAERLAMDNQAIWDNITSSLEDQYRTSLGRDANAEDLYYWMTQIESGAVSLDQALQLIASSTESVTLATASGVEALRKRAQLERQLLTLQGDTAELRRRELEELNPANRALQTRIWNLEYEKDAQAAANRAQQERIRNLEQEARAMMSAGGNIRQFVESLQNTAGAGLSPETAYQNAEESFLAAISTIYTSDDSALVQDTINGITGIAQQYLAAAEGYGASGSIYQQAQALVEGSLDDLAGRLGSDELTDIDPQLAAMVDQLKSVAANTGLAGPLAKQVPLAQTFSEFFGGSGSQNYMYRQLGALAGIEAAIRDTAAKAVEESTPQGRTLSVSQAAAALRGSGNSQLASLFSSSKSTAQHAGNLEYNLGGLLNGEKRSLVDTVTAQTIANALDFDESRYFELNEDGAAAVARGEFSSGLQHFVSHGLQEGRQFWEGGYTGPGGKYEPAGIVHRGEVVWSQDDISAWGGVGVVESLRRGPMELPMPDLPQFPALGQNDVLQVLQDVRRELVETRKQNQRLQEENNRHAAAAVAVQQEGFRQQISEQKKGNAALGAMASKARLEGSR